MNILRAGDWVIATYGEEEIMGHVAYIKDNVIWVDLTREADGLRHRSFARAELRLCPHYNFR